MLFVPYQYRVGYFLPLHRLIFNFLLPAPPSNGKKIRLGMLTLIEPPGAKRGVVPGTTRNSRSAQHLLNLVDGKGEDLVEEDFERPNEYALDKVLIGNSDSGDYSEKWKREFSQRPTWCDADMTLQQIQPYGKASGHKWALYSRSFIQRCLFWLGCALDKSALWVILVVLGSFLFSCYGLQHVKIETDIVKLWVSKGGRLDNELNYLSAMENKYGKTNWTAADDLHWLREQTDEKLANLAQEKPSEGGYQVVIQTSESEDENILTTDGLLRHVDLISEVAGFAVNVDGFNWTLRDICFKPGTIDSTLSGTMRSYADALEKIVPCVWITPLDCFWDGAKPLSPALNDELSIVSLLIETAYDLPMSWSTIKPQDLIDLVSEFADLGSLKSSFESAGISNGYVDRWCIDPYDPNCPQTAINAYVQYCDVFQTYRNYQEPNNISFSLEKDPDVDSDRECDLYRRSFMHFLRNKTAALDPQRRRASEVPGLRNCDEERLRRICPERFEVATRHDRGRSADGRHFCERFNYSWGIADGLPGCFQRRYLQPLQRIVPLLKGFLIYEQQ
ncbi:hypothetical protein L596_003189 [Steinernema carpocapsae]|uniref:Uncharacterized protein n=1 Tax=Steinernema carpocapsae TaxID=34508 RepID=A0A4U8UUN3_STECR|nr:hypothetical protein L596_003189 [Steinernema carpocapsae]